MCTRWARVRRCAVAHRGGGGRARAVPRAGHLAAAREQRRAAVHDVRGAQARRARAAPHQRARPAPLLPRAMLPSLPALARVCLRSLCEAFSLLSWRTACS